jgi:hypothetical protein
MIAYDFVFFYRLSDLETFQTKTLKNLESQRQKIERLKDVLLTTASTNGNSQYANLRLMEKDPVIEDSFVNINRNIATVDSPQVNLLGSSTAIKPVSPANNVDFEAVLGQLFDSLEDMKIPIRSKNSPLRKSRIDPQQLTNPTESSDWFVMSITDVDARLQELKNEKQRLRERLIEKI